MSPRSPSNSSSVSRNTSLSSTSATRTPISSSLAALFGAQEQRIAALTALVHLHLELRMGRRELRHEAVERRRLRPGEQRQEAARLRQQRLEHWPHGVLERRAFGDAPAVDDAGP